MTITIVQKSNLEQRKKDAKVSLVLAGGAVTGGTYKLGGLKALNDYFVNRKITDFDQYVGLSAGGLLSAAIANGVSPEEMLKSLSGRSKVFQQLHAWDFYWPNWKEFITRPLKAATDLITFSPVAAMVVAAAKPAARKQIEEMGAAFMEQPSYEAAENLAAAVVDLLTEKVEIPNLTGHPASNRYLR